MKTQTPDETEGEKIMKMFKDTVESQTGYDAELSLNIQVKNRVWSEMDKMASADERMKKVKYIRAFSRIFPNSTIIIGHTNKNNSSPVDTVNWNPNENQQISVRSHTFPPI